jgi:hypothetical protein
MNDPQIDDFDGHLDQAIESIAARPGRKRMMREELLRHLQEAYQVELDRLSDERAAIEAAITRLGSADELRVQLQASVPRFERVLFKYLDRKETFMLRWLWVVGVAAIVVANVFSFSQDNQVLLVGMALTCGLIFRHLLQKNNIASRFMGVRWPWLTGFVGVLFGTAIVLPAMAHMKQTRVFELLQLEFLAVGAMIVICGLYFIVQAVKTLVMRPV